ncbi:MAG: hypothetical protein AAF493_07650 [Pseudomonadota bacterium]
MAGLEDDIIQAVAIGNLKSISEQPAMLSNIAYSNAVATTNLSQQNAVATQQGTNDLGLAVTGNAVSTVSKLGPLEARSAVDVLTNNELAQTIADLKTTVAAFADPLPRGGDASNPLGPNETTFVRAPADIIVVGATQPSDVHVAGPTAVSGGAEIKITTRST